MTKLTEMELISINQILLSSTNTNIFLLVKSSIPLGYKKGVTSKIVGLLLTLFYIPLTIVCI